MKFRILPKGLLGVVVTGALAMTACGTSGAPSASAPPISRAPATTGFTVDGSPTFDKIKRRGKVVVGTKNDQPGIAHQTPSGKYEGFDIEIAKLVATKLGYSEDKIAFKPIPVASREQAVSNGDVDFYIGAFTISQKRKDHISFAGPYFAAGQDLLVRNDDASITGPDTLQGKKVCSETDSTPIQRVRELQLTAPTNIVEFKGYTTCVEALRNKQVDAVTTDDAILKGFAAAEPDKLRVVGKPFSKEPYGIGLALSDKALRNKIDDILQAAIDDGTWRKVYDATLGKSGSPAQPPQIERY